MGQQAEFFPWRLAGVVFTAAVFLVASATEEESSEQNGKSVSFEFFSLSY